MEIEAAIAKYSKMTIGEMINELGIEPNKNTRLYINESGELDCQTMTDFNATPADEVYFLEWAFKSHVINPHKGGRDSAFPRSRLTEGERHMLDQILAHRGISAADWASEKIAQEYNQIFGN